LIDVVIGKWRDEAAAEALLLRGRGNGTHQQERHEDDGEKGADQVDVPWLEPVAPNPGRRSDIVATASPKDKAET
jgi:hypothetical protein